MEDSLGGYQMEKVHLVAEPQAGEWALVGNAWAVIWASR